MKPLGSVAAPPEVVTMTSAGPALPAGVVTVICVALLIVKAATAVPPIVSVRSLTAVVLLRSAEWAD